MRLKCRCPWLACPRRHRGHPRRGRGRAPGLREVARRFLEAETRHLGVPLDAASVTARRSEGVPEVHITGAGRLLEHLAATEPEPLSNGSAFMALARIGAQAIVPGIETEAAGQHVR
jgi:hypothetical protein